MPVLADTKQRLEIALASAPAAADLLAIASSGSVVAQSAPAAVAAYAPGADLTGVNGTGSNAAPLAGTETRLDAVDAELAVLVAAVNVLRTKLIAAGVLV